MEHKLHVILHKDELDQSRLAGKIVVVLDVLFATSTIVTACDQGVLDVIPALDAAEARSCAVELDSGCYILAGEQNGESIEGFAPSTPLRLSQERLHGNHLIYATTNGTVALRCASAAATVYAAALLNGPAVVEHIVANHHATVLVICAGTFGKFNMEDFYGAGYLIEEFLSHDDRRWALSDAAVSARSIYRHWDSTECLLYSRVGQFSAIYGLTDEVRYAAREGISGVVPYLEGGRIRYINYDPPTGS